MKVEATVLDEIIRGRHNQIVMTKHIYCEMNVKFDRNKILIEVTNDSTKVIVWH